MSSYLRMGHMTRSTALVRRTELRNRTPMPRGKGISSRPRTPRGPGLAQRVAQTLGTAVDHKRADPDVLRSKQHRQNVAALGCIITGRPAQACHVNFGKGLALKTCDSLCFPLCPELHAAHDQGGMSRAERRRQEWQFADWTRAELLKKNLWPRSVEAHYQRAIQALKAVAE